MNGKTFFDAVRTIEDVMEFLKRYSIDGRMGCIDFLPQLAGTFYFELYLFLV